MIYKIINILEIFMLVLYLYFSALLVMYDMKTFYIFGVYTMVQIAVLIFQYYCIFNNSYIEYLIISYILNGIFVVIYGIYARYTLISIQNNLT